MTRKQAVFSPSSPLAAPRPLSVLVGVVTLSVAAAALAGPGEDHRSTDFPISVAEARDRAEARFQELDTDGSGEVSLDELGDARLLHGRGFHKFHRSKRHGGPRHENADERHEALNAELFERLDENSDGRLSASEFGTGELREARRDVMRERMFARLDDDGSGGLDRGELPDMTRMLEAMDADGDGTVSREEARAHHQDRREARQARRAENG